MKKEWKHLERPEMKDSLQRRHTRTIDQHHRDALRRVDLVGMRLGPRPLDGDHTVALRGNGGEGSDGKVERVVVVASRANIGDHSSDSLSIVGVLDVDPFTTNAGGLSVTKVGPVTVRVDGDDLVRVGVDLTTSTGVSTLVEVGSGTTGLDITGRRSTGGSSGSLGRSLVGRGSDRSDPLGSGGGFGPLDLGVGNGGRSGRSLSDPGRGRGSVILGSSLDIGRSGGGSGSLVLGSRRDLSGVGSAVRLSVVLQVLGSQHGSTAVAEEGGIVLLVAVESEVSGVVDIVVLEVTDGPTFRHISLGDRSGHGGGGSKSKDNSGVHCG